MVRLRRRSSFSEKPLQHELHGCPLHFEAQMVEVTSEWPEMHMAPGPPKKVGDATSKRRCEVVESVMDVQGLLDQRCTNIQNVMGASLQVHKSGQMVNRTLLPYACALPNTTGMTRL